MSNLSVYRDFVGEQHMRLVSLESLAASLSKRTEPVWFGGSDIQANMLAEVEADIQWSRPFVEKCYAKLLELVRAGWS